MAPHFFDQFFAVPSDYTSIPQVLTFSSSSTVQTMQISIVNDSALELSEVFTVSISLAENSNDIDTVELMPNSISVTIIDDDGIMPIFLMYCTAVICPCYI